MRLLAALLGAFLLMGVLAFPVSAEDPLDTLAEEVDPARGLSDKVLSEIGPYDGAVDGFGQRVLSLLVGTLGRIRELGFQEGLRTLGILLACALLCSLLEENSHGKAAATLVGSLTMTAACVPAFGSMITLGVETIRELHRYTELLLPAMGSLMALSGSPATAAVSGLGIVLLDGLQTLIPELFVPLLYLFVALCTAETALNLTQLAQLRGFLQWLMTTAVKLLVWGYSGILSLTGLVSGSLDAQKLRTLRSAIAGMVPMVGNLVSEASGSLLSAASLLRTSAGLYGMLAVLALCLGPFFRIALQYLLLKLGTALCGLFGEGSESALLEKLCSAMGFVLAFTGLACLLSLMILVLCIRTVNP